MTDISMERLRYLAQLPTEEGDIARELVRLRELLAGYVQHTSDPGFEREAVLEVARCHDLIAVESRALMDAEKGEK